MSEEIAFLHEELTGVFKEIDKILKEIEKKKGNMKPDAKMDKVGRIISNEHSLGLSL